MHQTRPTFIRRLAAAAVVAIAGTVAVTAANAAPAAKAPIVIGAAVDQLGNMAPVDGPALAAAQLEIKKINAAGGVLGHPLVMRVCNTQNNKPDVATACAANLISHGAKILWTTCDVDYAAPAVQQGLAKKILTVSPCIGTDQLGPKRFGPSGALAFSFGNVAQDEGAAMAEFAVKKMHWKTATVVTDNLLVYFKNVCKAFSVRFAQLGGKVVEQDSFTQGDKTVGNAASRAAAAKSQVITFCTAFGDQPTFVSDVRTLGTNTPILGPWASDGSFWLPKLKPPLSNVWSVTFASIFGDDPSKEVRSLVAQLTAEHKAPALAGFLPGADAIAGLAYAIKKAHGSTNGTRLASILAHFHNVKVPSGTISFSPTQHTVFGRLYRVVDTKNGKRHLVATLRASSPANIGG
ncbi:MAG TPA: ABC transporter substrate-binding protein [Gaiellaceae bacterium]|jgi:branched-chain amino acid transport system substrate-binding protein